MPMRTFVSYVHVTCITLVPIYAFHLPAIYVPVIVSTTKAGQLWPLHEERGGMSGERVHALTLCAGPRSLINGDMLGLI